MKRPSLHIGIPSDPILKSNPSSPSPKKSGTVGMFTALMMTSLIAVYLATSYGSYPIETEPHAVPTGNLTEAGEKLYVFLAESEFLRDFLCMESSETDAVFVSGIIDTELPRT